MLKVSDQLHNNKKKEAKIYENIICRLIASHPQGEVSRWHMKQLLVLKVFDYLHKNKEKNSKLY